jgi:hypothetical protein
MLTNFNINSDFSVSYEGHYFDLHNNFDFVGYDYEIAARRLTLTWVKSPDEWAKSEKFSKIEFVHFGVYFFKSSLNEGVTEGSSDDQCLEGMSFIPGIDKDSDDIFFIDQPQPIDGDVIMYAFVTDRFMRVGCDEIELVAK